MIGKGICGVKSRIKVWKLKDFKNRILPKLPLNRIETHIKYAQELTPKSNT